MKSKVIFASGLGNMIIFIQALIKNLNIKEKDKFLKFFLLNHNFNKLPFDIIPFVFFKLILLSIITLFTKNRIFILGLNLSKLKMIILSKITKQNLKFYAYPSIVFDGEKTISISEQDYYHSIIDENPSLNNLITNELLEKYKLEDNYFDYTQTFKKEIITIHLGSDSNNIDKRPFVKNIADALNQIPNKSKFIFLLLGQTQDKDSSDKFIEYIKIKKIDIEIIDLINKTSLFKLIDILMSSKFLISGDSGIRQIADFIGLDNIALFGPTSEIKNLIKPIIHKRLITRGIKCKGYLYNKCNCRKLNGYPEYILSISSENLYEQIKNFI
tara:strand:+ start:249 stop:1232 length:984 start_codon:yes stop_codon:yes gene_type:complete